MRSRDAVGRRITRVVQTRVRTNVGVRYDLVQIELDDGTVLYPTVHETEDELVVELRAIKRRDLERPEP